MKKISFLILTMITLLPLEVLSQRVETITLKDGSTIIGYVRIQDADSLFIETTTANIRLPRNAIMKKKAIQGKSEVRYDITLADTLSTEKWPFLRALGSKLKGAKILTEVGSIVTLEPDLRQDNISGYRFSWDAIDKINTKEKSEILR